MSESIRVPKKEIFERPDISVEEGEFKRVAETFGLDIHTLMFLASEEGTLKELDESVWSVLHNTESNRFEKGDWNQVEKFSKEQEVERNWADLKEKMENGKQVDAPIIMKYGDLYHLVSGNTRLMVARALGVAPRVLLFEYIEDRTDENQK